MTDHDVNLVMTRFAIVRGLRYTLHDMTGPLRAAITLHAGQVFKTPEEVGLFQGSPTFQVTMIAWFQHDYFGRFYRLLDEAGWALGDQGRFNDQKDLVRRAHCVPDIWRVVNAVNHEVIPALLDA
jgi:hypothetical protein